MDNAQKIWDRLISAGCTPAGSAGLMGNLYAESGLRPDNLQNTYESRLGFTDEGYTAAVDNGTYTNFAKDGAGYGLAQWTHPSRKANLHLFAKDAGKSIGDLEMQVDFLLLELQRVFPAVWDKLRTTTSVREASDCVLLQFERPADQSAANCARRAAYAQEFYNQFAGGETMYLMTSAELCAKALEIADNYKTSYMLGPWGWPANDKMIARATTQGSNAKTNKQWLARANAIKDRGFLFDCVGLIKGILWGWSGDLSRIYGGAVYVSNGVPDYDAKKMIDCCREVSTDFSSILPGEAVWMDGHIGIYVGAGVVTEATPKWQGGVQRSTLANMAGSQKLPGTVGSRRWTKHGKLPWVDYAAAGKNDEEDETVSYEQWKEYMERYRAELGVLPASGWAEEELAAAVDAGVTDGKRPRDLVTREEAAVMVVRGKLG